MLHLIINAILRVSPDTLPRVDPTTSHALHTMNPASDASPTREDTSLEERCPADDHMHGDSERYERQRRSLMRLMRNGALQAVDLDAVLREIATEIARTMNVERVALRRGTFLHRVSGAV